MDSDSLLFCMLANELEIAGLRASKSTPSSGDQTMPIPAHLHKRMHLSEQQGRSAGLDASHSTADLAMLQSCSGSYSQKPLRSDASDDDHCSWYEQQPAAHPAATSAAAAAASMPAAQPSADMSAVSKLKMLLASNSVVRETALKLLLQAPQTMQQQQQQSHQLLGQRQHLPQQQLAAAQDSWAAGVAACSEAAYSALPHSAQSAHSSLLHALQAGSSCTGNSGAYNSSRRSPQPDLPTDGFPANFPAGSMPAHVACSNDTEGWATELEGQLLDTLRREVHPQASFSGGAAACAGNSNQRSSSNKGMSSLQVLQQQQMSQQVQRGAYRHYTAPDPKQPTQQQQQACAVQYQQQNWGTMLAAAAAGAQNMTHWQPNNMNYAATEGHVSRDYAGCSPDPVSSSDTTGSAFAPTGAAHGSTHSINHQAGASFNVKRQAPSSLGGQEAQGCKHTGVKRASDIDQDLLLFNLLQDMAPAGRR